MKNRMRHTAVSGVIALPPRPTILAAALVATAVTFPVALVILLIDLLLL